ncbi:MAG: enediyne biosynthesis protein [Abditibacteriota bacterium]|nr:enediyne biosynthesis protein [Abditibacteriota bacterium]
MIPLFAVYFSCAIHSTRHIKGALFRAVCGLLCAIYLSGCSWRTPSATPQSTFVEQDGAALAKTDATKVLFSEVAAQSGLKFRHSNGGTGKFFLVENTPPGCALFDFDNDGDLDVFLVQSGPTGVQIKTARPTCKLFRNEGQRGSQSTFKDVTRGSGLDKDLGYAQGVAVADYDNDGYPDLFITAHNGNHLFRNERGAGRWKDVTKPMKLDGSTGYSTSAAWGDYDNDGKLDLYVCNYAKWSWQTDRACRNAKGERDYCAPFMYDPQRHHLYRNRGDRFEDVTHASGIGRSKGRGLAAAFFDYNGDNRQDIFVANDLTPNMLWRNEGNGKFTDVAVDVGVAFGENGREMAGMGIAIADYDHSGHASLYVTNYSESPNILFRNLGHGAFEDATGAAGLGLLHLKLLSFGCEFLDYDADGWSDLIANNGHVQMRASNRQPGVAYEQPKQLLHNVRGRFEEVTDKSVLGELASPKLGRGLAVGDYDNDGRLDILAANQNASVQLFQNRVGNGHHWVSFKTIGTKSNRDGLHAKFVLKAAGDRQTASVRAGSSYLSTSDRRVYFGLGPATRIDEVTVQWPSGTRDVLKNIPVDTFLTVTEGRGITAQHAPALP